jgi:hypothetical protein
VLLAVAEGAIPLQVQAGERSRNLNGPSPFEGNLQYGAPPLKSFALSLFSALLAGMVAACGVTHPVSPSRTNVQAAPGAANDIATGGQGAQNHNDRD